VLKATTRRALLCWPEMKLRMIASLSASAMSVSTYALPNRPKSLTTK
jgi:hypothetical protein